MADEEKELYEKQTLGEEIANSVAHGIGAVLSIAALVLLVVFASLKGDAWRVVSFSVFGATLVILFLMSAISHSLTNKRAKNVFEILDHESVYLLIAGTYTPITLVFLRGAVGWWLFGTIWALAILGITLEAVLKTKPPAVSAAIYIAMGWLIVGALKPLIDAGAAGFVLWLALGGISYTLGVVFYLFKKMPYHHFVWHLFVIAGAACHFFGFLLHGVK